MNTTKLNVLVLESEQGAADAAREELAAAGHTVLRCHEPGTPAFPCNALIEGKRCPLEAEIVDVALDVRRRPRSQPAPLEDGVRCALQRHVPLVVAGPAVLNPYDDYAVAVLDRTYDVVNACERAADAPLPAHTAAAAKALQAVLDRRTARAAPRVTVRRRRGALVVDVTDGSSLDHTTRGVAATRMMAAIREIDMDARGIDVVFDSS